MDAPGSQARYALDNNGAVRNWLVCGPVTQPLAVAESVIAPAGPPFRRGGRWAVNYWGFEPQTAALKLRVYDHLRAADWRPGALPALNADAPGGRRWQYRAADEDQVIDFSLFNFRLTRMQAWTFARLEAEAPLSACAELLTIGPCRVWLNGTLVHHYRERFSYVEPIVVPLTLELGPGQNDLYLQGEMVGWREARLALGLRFPDRPALAVALPLGTVDAAGWHAAETALSRLALRRFAFPRLPAQMWLDAGAPAGVEVDVSLTVPLPLGVPSIFQNELDAARPEGVEALVVPVEQGRLALHPGQPADLPVTPALLETVARLAGEHNIHLTARPTDGTPYTLQRELWASANDFRLEPYGSYDERRREALEHLAKMPYDVQGALAALETGRARCADSGAVALACTFMENRHDCADFYAVSLLALLARCDRADALRPADRARVEAAFTGFKFWIDEPGLDAMCYFTENHQILFHTAAYLAGQRWPGRVFANSGLTGRQQRDRARRRIEAWILTRLRGGYSEWDSNTYMALDAFALLALVEHAGSARLRGMAEALMHKTLFMLACQSWRGIHGGSHGRCYVEGLKTARVELTSGLQRIAWGLGTFNGETRPTGLLALARRYRVPELIQRIGADMPAALTTRARSQGRYRPHFDMTPGAWDVNTLTHRTPDGMIAAALDWRPGEPGIQEHLWQATLSTEAVIFTTHPGNSQEHGNARPNFWAGSARLPRVAMHDASVICLYNLALGGGLGFSHAYFPAAAFDDYSVEGQWAFARVGGGFVALWGDGDLCLTTTGRHAYQELRSAGGGRAWVCRLGRAATDGAYGDFCARLRQHAPVADNLTVAWRTPEGSTLAFGWTGAFTVDGRPQPLGGYPHYDNSYTHTALGADAMQLALGGETLTLNLT